jgi:hypothetical protein
MEAAEEEVRGFFDLSVQAGMHLCSKCTKIADSIEPEEHEPTADEIKAAVAEQENR